MKKRFLFFYIKMLLRFYSKNLVVNFKLHNCKLTLNFVVFFEFFDKFIS
ncbi:Uncharacterised protein [Salmonella enterica subsp. enterica serovar Typhimurium str. DT104]|nr:Uncharacterised protein [Salmonella enterica subsp. enterica serovar Typhimurium str. DT104]